MNIFYLDRNVKSCAEQHCDKHVVKMIVEYAQLLSTAHRVIDGTQYIEEKRNLERSRKIKRWKLDSDLESVLYKASHINHPSAIWARASDDNYAWLANLLCFLCEEYTHRYGKRHKVERTELCYSLLENIPKNIPIGDFFEPTPAMPDIYKVPGDSIQSYRNYYLNDKKKFATWKNRKSPEWWQL